MLLTAETTYNSIYLQQQILTAVLLFTVAITYSSIYLHQQHYLQQQCSLQQQLQQQCYVQKQLLSAHKILQQS